MNVTFDNCGPVRLNLDLITDPYFHDSNNHHMKEQYFCEFEAFMKYVFYLFNVPSNPLTKGIVLRRTVRN